MDEKELREFLIRQDAELKALMSKPHPELSARLLQVEQRLASPSPSGGSRMCLGVGDDIGLALTSSEGFKAVTKGANRSGQITVGSFHKAIVNASGQNQPLVPDMRVPGVIPPECIR